MIRKILFTLLILVLLSAGGLFALLATNSDIIIDRFHSYVENSTGAPLLTESKPRITLFPNRGLLLDASSWEKPDGTLRFSFSRASVLISSHALFSGRFSIKNFSVDDLDLTVKLKHPLPAYLRSIPMLAEHRGDLDDLIQSLLRALNIAPDTISIQRGRICLIEPDGSTVQLEPFTMEASNVHPGESTNLNVITRLKGTSPDFEAALDIRCTALFNRDKAAFSITKLQFAPVHGLSFGEILNLSGDVEYDFNTDDVKLGQLHFQGPELSATATGSIASLAQMYHDPRYGDATLNVELKGDPQRLASILKRPLPFADDTIFSDCMLAAQMHWSDGRLQMQGIRGKADALIYTGRLNASFRPFTLDGDIRFDELHLDAYRSRVDGSRSKLAERDFSSWPKVDIHVGADKVLWGGLDLENVQARLTGQSGTYEFNPLSAVFAGSPVTASMKTVLLPTTPLSARVSLNVSLPQADLRDLTTLLAQRPLLSGKGMINASLDLTTSRGLPSLSGQGSLTSSKAETLFSILPDSMPQLPGVSAPRSFERLFCAFAISKGMMSIDSFSLSDSKIALNGKGTADLTEKTVEASGTLVIANSAALPVKLSGHFNKLDYAFAAGEDTSRGEGTGRESGLTRQLKKIIGAGR